MPVHSQHNKHCASMNSYLKLTVKLYFTCWRQVGQRTAASRLRISQYVIMHWADNNDNNNKWEYTTFAFSYRPVKCEPHDKTDNM